MQRASLSPRDKANDNDQHVHGQVGQGIRDTILGAGPVHPRQGEVGPAAEASLRFQAVLEPSPVLNYATIEFVRRRAPSAIELTTHLHIIRDTDKGETPAEASGPQGGAQIL